MRRLLLIPIFVPQLFALYTFLTKCITLQDPFYFHPDATSLKVLEQANNDFGIPIFIIRVMHNKFVQSLIDTFYHFLQYIESFFIAAVIGFIGWIFFALGIWYIFTKGKKYVVFLVPLVFTIIFELFFHHATLPFHTVGLALSYLLISGVGAVNYTSSHRKSRSIIFIVLLSLTSILWLIFLPSDLYKFCIQR